MDQIVRGASVRITHNKGMDHEPNPIEVSIDAARGLLPSERAEDAQVNLSEASAAILVIGGLSIPTLQAIISQLLALDAATDPLAKVVGNPIPIVQGGAIGLEFLVLSIATAAYLASRMIARRYNLPRANSPLEQQVKTLSRGRHLLRELPRGKNVSAQTLYRRSHLAVDEFCAVLALMREAKWIRIEGKTLANVTVGITAEGLRALAARERINNVEAFVKAESPAQQIVRGAATRIPATRPTRTTPERSCAKVTWNQSLKDHGVIQ